MFWRLSFYRILHPSLRYAWCQVRILKETDKALLVYNGGKTWVPKSQIQGIRLQGFHIEIFVQEGALS